MRVKNIVNWLYSKQTEQDSFLSLSILTLVERMLQHRKAKEKKNCI